MLVVNPHPYGSPEWHEYEQQKAHQVAKDLTINPKDPSAMQEYLTGRSGYLIQGLADGGEVLPSPLEPAGDLSLLTPDGAPPTAEEIPPSPEDPLAALKDVLGPEKSMELDEAVAQYPVVMEVAEMATVTSDGEVDGLGTGTSDDVPARLSDGEFVFSKEAVDIIGLQNLEEMHNEAKNVAMAS